MSYVDGFVIAIPKSKIEDYKKVAGPSGKIWMEHGALSYKECILEDAQPAMPEEAGNMRFQWFGELAKINKDETVVFSYILYKSRAHRDEVNAKVMQDPRMGEICPNANGGEPPFDMNRMTYGGFEAIIDL